MQKRVGEFGIFRTECQLCEFGRQAKYFRDDLLKGWQKGVKRPRRRIFKAYQAEIEKTIEMVADLDVQPIEPIPSGQEPLHLYEKIQPLRYRWGRVPEGDTFMLPTELGNHIQKSRKLFEEFARGKSECGQVIPLMTDEEAREYGERWHCQSNFP